MSDLIVDKERVPAVDVTGPRPYRTRCDEVGEQTGRWHGVHRMTLTDSWLERLDRWTRRGRPADAPSPSRPATDTGGWDDPSLNEVPPRYELAPSTVDASAVTA